MSQDERPLLEVSRARSTVSILQLPTQTLIFSFCSGCLGRSRHPACMTAYPGRLSPGKKLVKGCCPRTRPWNMFFMFADVERASTRAEPRSHSLHNPEQNIPPQRLQETSGDVSHERFLNKELWEACFLACWMCREATGPGQYFPRAQKTQGKCCLACAYVKTRLLHGTRATGSMYSFGFEGLLPFCKNLKMHHCTCQALYGAGYNKKARLQQEFQGGTLWYLLIPQAKLQPGWSSTQS